jgi:hypothetical protein
MIVRIAEGWQEIVVGLPTSRKVHFNMGKDGLAYILQ